MSNILPQEVIKDSKVGSISGESSINFEEFELKRTLKHLQRAVSATNSVSPLNDSLFPEISDAEKEKLRKLVRQVEEKTTDLAPVLDRIEAVLRTSRASMEEVRRLPSEFEPSRISPSRILVCPKRSRFELDMARLKLSEMDLLAYYKEKQIDGDAIYQSHIRQRKAYGEFKQLFPEGNIVYREKVLDTIAASPKDLIISLGGDDHFTYVSHFLKDTFLLGISSDPLRSEGALLSHVADDIYRILAKLESGDFFVEDWTRLDCKLNGTPIQSATGTFFLGDLIRLNMSKYRLSDSIVKEEQKGSGLLVATGAGSTGWYNSEIGSHFLGEDKFPRTAKWGRFGATGIYHGRISGRNLQHGTLKEGEGILVESLHDFDGIIGVDSVEQYKFNRGDRAIIRISNTPLKVLWTDK